MAIPVLEWLLLYLREPQVMPIPVLEWVFHLQISVLEWYIISVSFALTVNEC